VPELTDVAIYLEALTPRIQGRMLERIRTTGPSLLRSVDPPPSALEGRKVVALRRLGKRIVYREQETNYCAQCQTGGRLLADRALSRLLKKDWPRSLEELEAMRSP
jgi:formamidopyrimidine-DNA glycosylase